jgi:hypothetical protein
VPQRPLAALRSRELLAKAIPRRPRIGIALAIALALAFGALVLAVSTADRWLGAPVVAGQPAPYTVRIPALAGLSTSDGRISNGAIVIARGQIATPEDVARVAAVTASLPHGPLPYATLFTIPFVLALLFSHRMRGSTRGRLTRVQVVSFGAVIALAIAVKALLLFTPVSVMVVPVGVLALLGVMALDRVVGIATGVLGALVIALVGPFDVGTALVLLVQATVAGVVVSEQPKDRWRTAVTAGVISTACAAATYLILAYLTTGALPTFTAPLQSPWFAALAGPVIATVLAVPLMPLYQRCVGEITRGQLVELEDLAHPLLKQISEKSPGSWQHSLAMANMAEIAANAIGASGRLVRVGAYFHDLGKSLQPKFFIENLEPGETSPHDKLPPEVSTDHIFAHVTEGIATARKAGLHERIVDFMHMHHGNGVLEYFWGKAQEQGNPNGFDIDNFRYPGHPPQTRETAILTICDAVEAASRTLKKPDAKSIDALVQRIVYGKLHLGQLDESGLSMADLRLVSESLKETIRHANHGRIEYPWQKAQQDASAATPTESATTTQPRLDSLDRKPEATANLKEKKSDADITETKVEKKPELKVEAKVEPKVEPTVEEKPSKKPDAIILDEMEKRAESQRYVDETRPAPKLDDDPEISILPVGPTLTSPPIELARKASSSAPPATKTEPVVPDKAAAPNEAMRDSAPTIDVDAVKSWTEKGAAEAPWPELRGEPSEKLRAVDLIKESGMRKRAATLPPIKPPTTPPPLSAYKPPTTPPPDGDRSSRTRLPTNPPLPSVPKPPTNPPPIGQVSPKPPTVPPPVGGVPDAVPTTGSSATSRPGTNPPPMGTRRPATIPPIHPVERKPSDSTPPASPAQLFATSNNPAPQRFNTTLAPEHAPRPPALILDEDAPPTAYTDQTVSGFKIDPEELETSDLPIDPPTDVAIRAVPPGPNDLDDAGSTNPSMLAQSDASETRDAMHVVQDDAVLDEILATPQVDDISTSFRGNVAHVRSRPPTAEQLRANPSINLPSIGDDTATTNPAMPRFVDSTATDSARRRDFPLKAPPTLPPHNAPASATKKSLADRIDSQIANGDEWSRETPVVAPTSAELRALLGNPDVTREVDVDEIERLHHKAFVEQRDSQEILLRPPTRRQPHPTAEVDPDDIEAAIEIHPPARRPTSLGTAKPKKD